MPRVPDVSACEALPDTEFVRNVRKLGKRASCRANSCRGTFHEVVPDHLCTGRSRRGFRRAIAATFSRARDHRSIQLKAASAVQREAESADLPEIARQSTILRDELVALGYTRAQAIAYTAFDPSDLAVVEFTPERVFTQTPGPGAGAELRR